MHCNINDAEMPPAGGAELTIAANGSGKKRRPKGQHQSSTTPSSGLICCCRTARRGKLSMSSPIYTAREVPSSSSSTTVVASPTRQISNSRKRPLVHPANVVGGQFRIAISQEGPFADGTPSNVADYLDCNGFAVCYKPTNGNTATGQTWSRQKEEEEEEEESTEQMRTARTSRREELIEYPSMNVLVQQILLEAGEMNDTRKVNTTAAQMAGGPHANDRWNGNATGTIMVLCPSCLDQFPVTQLPPQLPQPTTTAAAAFTAVALPAVISDVQLHRPLTTSWRLTLSALPQTVTELFGLIYFWMASSVAILLEWLF